MGKCDYYHLRSETRYSCLPPFNSQTTVYGVCFGTKEQDRCNCDGDESKCSFYPEKRKAAEKKMNTAEMWLKAQEDGKTYLSRNADVIYSKEIGFVDRYDNQPVFPSEFDTFESLMESKWEEIKIMTKTDAEKEFGIKIVG